MVMPVSDAREKADGFCLVGSKPDTNAAIGNLGMSTYCGSRLIKLVIDRTCVPPET